jgi:glyoxylase-like metal-dependent hydrolase (beta-lactamase superfamily II)
MTFPDFLKKPEALLWPAVALAWAAALYVNAQAPQPDGAGIEPGKLPAKWSTGGPKCMELPEWQVHEYNEDLYILRESGCVHYEKPFLYLIFGKDKAMLMDTGAGTTDLAPFIDQLLARWCQRKKRESIPLMVMHSHGHGDHVARDAQFRNRPGVEFIPAEVPDLQKAFGIETWPTSVGKVDLGGRVLDVVPVPGHHPAAIALYDRRTALFLPGDNVYPGRLYVSDWPAFVASTQRMVDFLEGRLVSHILGCHIEQTKTPYLEYTIGSIFQPDEHVLELSRGDLIELNEALKKIGPEPKRLALRSMTIFPIDPFRRGEMQKLRKETEDRQRETMYNQPPTAN